MKDVQGIQRGKCNAPGCECEEYRTSADGQSGSASGKFRCEYCDHTPVQHVKIIELGECKACGKDNCEKYEFEDPNSYSNCAYCDCPASEHAGAEKLRKPQPQQQSASMIPGGMATVPSGGFQPRMDARGQPTQSPQLGMCKFPGCKFPKRVEGNKLHDFCSRTCAKNYSQLQPPGGTQLIAPSKNMSGPGTSQMYSQGPSPNQLYSQGPSPPNPATTASGQPTTAMTGGTGGGYGQSTTGYLPTAAIASSSYRSITVVSKGLTPCKNCGTKPANPGRSWCESCYQTRKQ